MADPTTDGAAAPAATEPEFSLQGVYLKDCSFEAPKGPRQDGQWNPQISLDLNTAAEPLDGDTREVVLTVSVTAKINDVTVFLVEVKQAGLFGVRNLSEADHRRAVASVAPNILFPYARADRLASRVARRLPADAAAARQLRRPVRCARWPTSQSVPQTTN
jgi:preprotein translocase subunit SecB